MPLSADNPTHGARAAPKPPEPANTTGTAAQLPKIFHISDLHIRSSPQRAAGRYEEFSHVFEAVTRRCRDACREAAPQRVIVAITGDVFHCKQRYSPQGLALFHVLVQELACVAHAVWIIPGNHDVSQADPSQPDLVSTALGAYADAKVRVLDRTCLLPDVVPGVDLSVLDVRDVLVPGAGHGVLPPDQLPDVPRRDTANLRVALFHGTVLEMVPQARSGVPASLFDGFDAVLLGDIHAPGARGADPAGPGAWTWPRTRTRERRAPVMAYAGSLVQQNAGEPLHPHGFLLWDLERRTLALEHVANASGFADARTSAERPGEWEVRCGKAWVRVGDAPAWFPEKVQFRVQEQAPLAARQTLQTLGGVRYQPPHAGHAQLAAPAACALERLRAAVRDAPDAGDAWLPVVSSLALAADAMQPAVAPDLLTASQARRLEARRAEIAKRTDAAAVTEARAPAAALRIRAIAVNYVLCFGRDVRADLAALGRGLVCVAGRNSSGKSSLLEAVVFALYGTGFPSRLGSDTSHFVHKRRPEGESSFVRLSVSVDGVAAEIHRSADNSRLTTLTSGDTRVSGNKQVTAWVAERIGGPDVFLTKHCVTQNNDMDPLAASAQQQRALLDRVFALAEVDAVRDAVKESALAHRQLAEWLQDARDALPPDAHAALERTRGGLAEAEAAHAAAAAEREALRASATPLRAFSFSTRAFAGTGTAADARRRLAEARKALPDPRGAEDPARALAEINDARDLLRRLARESPDAAGEHEQCPDGARDDAPPAALRRLADLVARRPPRPKAAHAGDRELEARAARAADEVAAARERYADLMRGSAAREAALDAAAADEAAAADALRRLSDPAVSDADRERFARLDARLAGVTVRDAGMAIAGTCDKCSVCAGCAASAHRALAAGAREPLKTLSALTWMDSMRERVAACEAWNEAQARARRAAAALDFARRDARDAAVRQQRAGAAVCAASEAAARLERELAEARACRDAARAYELWAAETAAAAARLRSCVKRWLPGLSDILRLETVVDELPAFEEARAAALAEQRADERVVRTASELSAARERQAAAAQAARRAARLEDAHAEAAAAAHSMQGLHAFVSEFKESSYRTWVREEVVRCANEVLEQQGGNVRIDAEWHERSACLAWLVADACSGADVPMARAGGFQRASASLALRIVLGACPSQLFIDEAFVCFDSDNVHLVRPFLASLLTTFEQIFYMTHIPDVADAEDATLALRRADGFTEVHCEPPALLGAEA